MRGALSAVLLGSILAAASGRAQTFRYASTGDLLTLDPHSADEALSNSFKNNIYEGLVRFNEKLEPEPALAPTRRSPTPSRTTSTRAWSASTRSSSPSPRSRSAGRR